MKKAIQYVLMFLLAMRILPTSFAQKNAPGLSNQICGSDLINEKYLKDHPDIKRKIDSINLDYARVLRETKNIAKRMVVENGDTVYYIPVVIHVIHTGDAIGSNYNPNDDTLTNWINFTNAVYACTWSPFPNATSGGAKIKIRFALAKRDTNCLATTGIDRINASTYYSNYADSGLQLNGSGGGVPEANIRNLLRWDPTKYYNIYVVSKIAGRDGYTGSGSYVAGYAYLAGASSDVDGTFMLAHTAHTGDITMPHEFGHSMGLYHVFEGGPSDGSACPSLTGTCDTNGDYVCDTEPIKSMLGTWPVPDNTATNPCTNANYQSGQYNIMNYGYTLNRFTQGQADRALAISMYYKSDLLHSLGADDLTTNPPQTISMVSANCTPAQNTNPTGYTEIGVVKFRFNGISNSPGGYDPNLGNYYTDYATSQKLCLADSLSTTVVAGNTYSLYVTSGSLNPQNVKVYLDYNNDGAFSESGQEYLGTFSQNTNTITQLAVNIPSSPTVLNTPLRLRVRADLSIPASNCSTLSYGQTVDYAVTIVNSSALPLNFTSFNVENNECSNIIKWSVGGNTHIANFILEKSLDGISYTQLAEVAYGVDVNQYIYTDKNVSGTCFYRVRIKDVDATTDVYSQVAKAYSKCGTNNISIFPNPAKNNLFINYNSVNNQSVKLTITDIQGRTIANMSKNIIIGAQTIQLPINGLSSGSYLLQIKDNAGVTTHKFVIE